MMRAIDNEGRPDPLWRGALATGFAGLTVGLGLGAVALLRPEGLGVAPVLASSPLHLQAMLLILCGCVPLALGLTWESARLEAPSLMRVRPWVLGGVVLSAAGGGLAIIANWLVVTGYTSDVIGLLPGLVWLGVAFCYVSAVYPLSGSGSVGLSGRLLLRSSCLWLAAAAASQFSWIAGRVFLDNPKIMWFVERPTIEVGLLGFVALASLGLMLAALPTAVNHRNLIQALLRSHHAANGLIFGWGSLQTWSLRYPGGYQNLVLALVALGIVIVVAVVAVNSGLLDRWQALWDGTHSDDRLRSVLAVLAMGFFVALAVLLAITAFAAAAAGRIPPPELLESCLLAVAVGMSSACALVLTSCFMRDVPQVTSLGAAATTAGVVMAMLLVIMSIPVERSLADLIGGSYLLAMAGLAALALSSLPWRRVSVGRQL
ncbi:MAG: hypothetical protein U9R79_05410 [Armatimonadota bacterium]|nr:hypothetical protein [Armatimonadota bacterium]